MSDMMQMSRRCIGAAVFSLVFISTAESQVRLASIFGDNMIVQRDVPIPVWGQAPPGATITIRLSYATASTSADNEGNWKATISKLAAGGPFDLTVVSSETLIVRNVLVGEVWLCSGQSNMEFRLDRSDAADSVIAAALNPKIRLCTVQRAVSETAQISAKASWVESSPTTVGRFSAVAYFFGKKLLEELDVPVGLVHASWGGTAAESWMPPMVLADDSEFAPILQRWQSDLKKFPELNATFQDRLPALMAQWRSDSAAAAADGKAPPARPQLPRGPGSRDTPSGQWNAMIHPLIPFAVKGVIWYQGEANASRAYQYRRLFPALIRSWRKTWENEKLPFYYVQLPNLFRQPDPSKSVWAELRESQLQTLSLTNTGMAVTIDVGDSMDIHPRNKKPVGERLARIALNKDYGHSQVVPSGPVYAGYRPDGASIRISFSEIDGGLLARSVDNITGFVVAGEDRIFVPARAKIEANEVVVWCDRVQQPVAVRYAWGDNPEWSLMNAAGLPASPFRTDDWPLTTFGRK